MSASYQLEKWVWTEADFEQMGWHDARIYAVQFGQEISFDIDYIFQWVQSDEDDYFSFWVAPATLIFPEAVHVAWAIDFRPNQELEIEHISRQTSAIGATVWCIETHQGDIRITAEGFRQIIRRPPTLQVGQQITPEERGASNFDVTPDTAFTESEEVRLLKKADFALRQKATEVRRIRRQLEALLEQRSAGVLEVKRYLQEKRSLEEKIKQLRNELDSTDWAREI
ncbi:hypothetical protein ACFPAF_04615 [Hymenobacter endophyticus]|uniref:Uncharacterized protein n=1 Tax=Hymenobacter endophyticus TaxID=3076335 RepID=A0ABU3TE65_9BACT|nr:hypothetical protein [Hymenobacter endophyticus]MDU0369667.1 hypothetical protein [Hymenobacter endophyticus]